MKEKGYCEDCKYYWRGVHVKEEICSNYKFKKVYVKDTPVNKAYQDSIMVGESDCYKRNKCNACKDFEAKPVVKKWFWEVWK